ncbi:hypothetical protein NJB1907f44_42750 [Mycobacterium marinum]|nr:hypothetical protein NJB1907f34b_33900 [Mycobacterium marinum]GJO18324.1 hypothetical protein NJB1907E90_47480 [Mycobacterium marinum]GJO26099.1 hypothetical protein NJB1907E11_41380 [Mycobacterium marinum]GJO38156.1 hypothetical protein NJB1907f22_45320 [Mycobacterium marinum]GJO46597.1 hypothetical protein NJB1907E19_41400 [Mycobacterium marinum]
MSVAALSCETELALSSINASEFDDITEALFREQELAYSLNWVLLTQGSGVVDLQACDLR